MDNLKEIKNYLKLLVAVVFIALAVNGAASIATARIATDLKSLAQQNRSLNKQNQTVLTNFSDYSYCLNFPDEKHLAEIGKEAYFFECDQLLFRGTGINPTERHQLETTPTTSKP